MLSEREVAFHLEVKLPDAQQKNGKVHRYEYLSKRLVVY